MAMFLNHSAKTENVGYVWCVIHWQNFNDMTHKTNYSNETEHAYINNV